MKIYAKAEALNLSSQMCDDVELFDMAFSAAKKIISDDPELKKEKNAALREAVENHLTCNLSTIS